MHGDVHVGGIERLRDARGMRDTITIDTECTLSIDPKTYWLLEMH